MKSINLINEVSKTKLEVRIWEDAIPFFVLPRKHSKYWIPIKATNEQYKQIKDALLEA